VVYTNTPVTGGTRGWGAPEIFAAVETHLQRAAEEFGIDPVELRLKNLVHPYDNDPIKKISLGNARIIDCLERGAEAFSWKSRYNRPAYNRPGYNQPGGEGRVRTGVGVACGAHKNGMFGRFPEHSSMVMKMHEDGSFTLNTGLHELGCGIVTTIRLIAAETLGVAPETIEVTEADTESGPYDFGTFGSRVTYVSGACAREIAELMKAKIIDSASIIFAASPHKVVADRGWVWPLDREHEKKPFHEIARRAKTDHDSDIIVAHTYHGKSNPGVYGAHFAEVSVDILTGMVQVIDYLAVHDIGKAINPGMVEGQIHGSVQMGIGYALSEEVKIEENGAAKNSSFREYHLLNAPAMPHVSTLLIEEGGDDGPFGAKSIGEIATVPVAPAVVNAVNHALRGLITEPLTSLPLTPEKITEAVGLRKGVVQNV
jgi:xanthine dehydrogenase molybdenum-binding subunit